MSDIVIIIIAAFVCITFISSKFLSTLSKSTRRLSRSELDLQKDFISIEKFERELKRERLKREKELPSSIESKIADNKKDIIQKKELKTFYYLDEILVSDLYDLSFPVIEPKEIQRKVTGSSRKGLKAKIKIIEPEIEKSNSTQTTEMFEVNLTPVNKYNNVEKYLFDHEEVSFAVEGF